MIGVVIRHPKPLMEYIDGKMVRRRYMTPVLSDTVCLMVVRMTFGIELSLGLLLVTLLNGIAATEV